MSGRHERERPTSPETEKAKRDRQRLEAAENQANRELERQIADEIEQNPIAIHDPDEYAVRRRESLEDWRQRRIAQLLSDD